jgi:hypothetical protein
MKNQIEVPKDALSLKFGADERMVYPEKGDPVEFRVEGTIRKVHEGSCTVDVKFINGMRPGPGREEPEFIPSEVSEEEDALRTMAEAADAGASY